MLTEKQLESREQLLALFQIDGVPANQCLTEGEKDIFGALVYRPVDRLQIVCSTQYGKSLTVALACIIITCVQDEVVAVVAPRKEQAKIIMRYFIEHLGDDEAFSSKLEKDTKLERLRMEESKERIMLNNGGGIYTLSAQAGYQKGIEAAMGSGAKIVIEDESSLIPDQIEATVFRMIAGKKDAFYCKVGNPFYRNHFYKSWQNPDYEKIFIDYNQALSEGRYNQKFIEEARKKPHFDILFGCLFPPEDRVDDQGYTRLFTDELVSISQRVVEPFGEIRLGVDIAEGGGDDNAFVLRWPNYAMCVNKYKADNTMQTAGECVMAMKEYEVYDENLFVDNLGVGKGVYDRLTEQNYRPVPVRFSEKAQDEKEFANVRAECYWMLYQWLKQGGCLEPSVDWEQLTWIKYKVDSSGRIQIKPKEEMRKEGLPSPDVVDALTLTFARRSVINKSREERLRDRELLKQFDAHKSQKSLTGSRYLRR